MTVAELIAELQNQPQNAEVAVYSASADETGSDIVHVETLRNEVTGLETVIWIN